MLKSLHPQPLKGSGVKIRKKRVGEQMGEQKLQNAKRPHKLGPLGANMAEAMSAFLVFFEVQRRLVILVKFS